MKKALALLGGLTLLALAFPASATGVSTSGTLAIGLGNETGSLRQEYQNRVGAPPAAVTPWLCGSANPLTGIDRQWYDVSAHIGHAITVTPTGPARMTFDFDGYFFNSSCQMIAYGGLVQGSATNGTPPDDIPFSQMGDVESGTVPAGAKWLMLVLYSGVNGTYSISF